MSTPGFAGRNGLRLDEDHKEVCGQTPIGVYTFNAALGIADDLGCAIPYTKVTEDIYWSGDMRGDALQRDAEHSGLFRS